MAVISFAIMLNTCYDTEPSEMQFVNGSGHKVLITKISYSYWVITITYMRKVKLKY